MKGFLSSFFLFLCNIHTYYYRKEVLNMVKGFKRVKQWAKDNETLAWIGFVAGTSVVVGGIVYSLSKGEDVSDKLDVVEETVEDFNNEVKIFLGGLNNGTDAGAWMVNVVDRLKDSEGNVIEYSMEKVAEDILSGNYKEI